MRVAIVGSRGFPNLDLVRAHVEGLPPNATVILGGAGRVDRAAAQAARARGLDVLELLPHVEDCRARRRRVVETADRLLAFTDRDAGGAWDAVKRARAAGIPATLVRSGLAAFAGRPGAGAAGLEALLRGLKANRFRRGPYHVKRAGLGTFALHDRRRIPAIEYADALSGKDERRPEFIDRIARDVTAFAAEHPVFVGRPALLTTPPRNKRRSGRPHIMTRVLEDVSQALGIPYAPVFRPGDRRSRGRFAGGYAAVLTNPLAVEGKAVLCIDDFCTTGRTMHSSLLALHAAGANARGLVWMAL